MSATHAAPLPLTVVGGFLGAGKTTLVNAVLADAGERRLAVLVNDFGALSIDAALIASRNARTIALANGCVCCTLVNGLVQALLDLLRLDPPPEHVLVEASGVADPRRIAQIARADRSFAQDATIVVVAADRVRALAADRYVGDTVQRQLDAADLIVLNKLDLVSGTEADATAAWLRSVAPRARLIRATNARLPCDVVLGAWAGGESPTGANYARHETDHGRTFASRTLRCAGPIREATLRRALDALSDRVLRVKGFVRFDAAPERVHLVQAVGRRVDVMSAPLGTAVDGCVLVVVAAGAALEDAELGDLARAFAS